jgi:hypothetical protein
MALGDCVSASMELALVNKSNTAMHAIFGVIMIGKNLK